MALAYLSADYSCRLKKVVISCLVPTQGLVLSGRPRATLGIDVFALAGPKLWNSLPAGFRQRDIVYEQFKQLLKTFLFGCRDCGTL